MKKHLFAIVLCIVLALFNTAFGSSTKDITQIDYGDSIFFGHYPQKQFTGDDYTPIEWVVYNKTGSEVLLFSKYILSAQPYNEKEGKISWGKSSLRKWLNGDFKNIAFSKEEQKQLKRIKRPDITDDISLMTIQEVNSVFDTYMDYLYADGIQKEMNKNIYPQLTPFAFAEHYSTLENAIRDWEKRHGEHKLDWWTCTVSDEKNKIYDVNTSSIGIDPGHTSLYYCRLGVRPVIKLDLSKVEPYISTP